MLTNTGRQIRGQGWGQAGAILIFLLACNSDIVAQQLTDDVYDFEGYRAIVPLLSEEELLSLDPGSEATDALLLEGAAQEHERALFVTALDGILWGDGENRYAAQWYNRLGSHNDSSWSHFRGGMSPFPRWTRMMGRSGDFAWIGIASHGIHVRDIDDESDRFFLADLNILDQIARFTFDYEGAFERYGIRGTAGELTRDGLMHAGETHVTRFRFVPERAPTIEWMLYVAHRLPELEHPEWWCFVVNNHGADVSVLYMIRLRMQDDGKRAIPVSVEDIRAAHHDVETIENIGIREHEENAPPGADRSGADLNPVSSSASDADSRQMAAVGWLAASSAALCFFIFQARKRNKRKDGVR